MRALLSILILQSSLLYSQTLMFEASGDFNCCEFSGILNEKIDNNDKYFPFYVVGSMSAGILVELTTKLVMDKLSPLRGDGLNLVLLNAGCYAGILIFDNVLDLQSNPIGALLFAIPGNIFFYINALGIEFSSPTGFQRFLPYVWIPMFMAIGNRTNFFQKKAESGTALLNVYKTHSVMSMPHIDYQIINDSVEVARPKFKSVIKLIEYSF
ncbi:hypothetical protein KAR48_17765 [bacterium]|nr:hypothetical protein [bacterium]